MYAVKLKLQSGMCVRVKSNTLPTCDCLFNFLELNFVITIFVFGGGHGTGRWRKGGAHEELLRGFIDAMYNNCSLFLKWLWCISWLSTNKPWDPFGELCTLYFFLVEQFHICGISFCLASKSFNRGWNKSLAAFILPTMEHKWATLQPNQSMASAFAADSM